MGVAIVKDNYIRKSQAEKILASDEDEYKKLDKMQAEIQKLYKSDKPEDIARIKELQPKVTELFNKLYEVKTFSSTSDKKEDTKEIPAKVKDEIKRYLKEVVFDIARDIKVEYQDKDGNVPDDLEDEHGETPSVDVRLQWYNNQWQIHTGDSSYDTDHRGYWGASGIQIDTDYKKLADDLIDQVEMSMAEGGDIEASVAVAEDLSKDLAEIKSLLKGVKLDKYAKAYYDKLEEAAMHYGKAGLQSQVAYLLFNLEGQLKPEVEKRLQDYADAAGNLGCCGSVKPAKSKVIRDLKKLGISVVKGKFVKRSQVEEILASKKITAEITLDPVDVEDWKKFADSYRDTYEDVDSWVEPAGEDKVKLTDKWVKELQRTYKVFTDGEAQSEYEDECYKMLEDVLKSLIEKACKKLDIDPKEVTYTITVDEGDSETVTYNGEELELEDGYFYYTDNEAYEAMTDSFNSWEWLALLADEESPWYDSTFVDGYKETEAAQARRDLTSYNDHTKDEWEKEITDFLEREYKPSFEKWKK